MKSLIWIGIPAAVLLLLFLGVPAARYLLSRLRLLAMLRRLRREQTIAYTFRKSGSLWGFNNGRHADLLIVKGRHAYLVKLGGSFKRATVITITAPRTWVFTRYYRSPSLSGAPIFDESHARKIPFDLLGDTAQLAAALPDDRIVTPVYLLTPKPLGIQTAAGPLSNGDTAFGVTIGTATWLETTLKTTPAASPADMVPLQTAFQSLDDDMTP